MTDVIDNKASHRFELQAQGDLAFANYRRSADKVIITTPKPRRRCAAAESPRRWSRARST